MGKNTTYQCINYIICLRSLDQGLALLTGRKNNRV